MAQSLPPLLQRGAGRGVRRRLTGRDMQPVITIALIRQPDLDDRTRARLWHSVRTELLAAIGCLAAADRHPTGGQLMGFSEMWDVVLSGPELQIYPRTAAHPPSLVAIQSGVALRALGDVARRRPNLIGTPLLTAGR